MSVINLHDLHSLPNLCIFCSLGAMEVFDSSGLILPNVHGRKRLKSNHRLRVHNQAVAGLAQSPGKEAQLS
jgi:hypothetical protein